MFKKNKKQTETIKEPKEKKVRTFKVGTHKKSVIALWKGSQRHLYFPAIGHLSAEDGKQRQQYGKRPRGGGLHLQAGGTQR